MAALVLLVPALVLAPFFCADVGPGWPSQIRDRLLRVLTWSGVVALAWLAPGLGLFFGVVCWHWSGPRELASVVTVGAGVAVYLTARALSPDLVPLVQWVIVLGVLVQIGLAVVQMALARLAGVTWHLMRESARGTVGNRVVVGCLSAMVLPLAPPVLMPVFAGGVLLSQSFSALVALGVALTVLWPSLWGLWLALAVGAWFLVRRHRPTPLAGMASRIRLARLCWRALRRADWGTRLMGFGGGAFFRYSKWWLGQRQTVELFKHAHNDAVQVAFEWGAVGGLSVMLFAGMTFWQGGWGSPVTAALAAVAANALFQFPLHLPHVLVPTLVLAGMVGR